MGNTRWTTFGKASFVLLFLAALTTHAQWHSLSGPPAADVHAITMSAGRLLVGTMHGVYASEDTGKTWKFSGTGMDLNSVICAFGARGTTVFAGVVRDTSGRLFRSHDRGVTWNEIPMPYGAGSIVSITPTDGMLILAAVGVWVSTNDGDTWEERDGGLCKSVCSFAVMSDSSTGKGTVLFMSLDDRYSPDGLWYQCGGGLWKSNDTGRTWRRIDSALKEGAWDTLTPYNFLFTNRGRLFAYSNQRGSASNGLNGILTTSDQGRTWGTSNVGLTRTSAFAMAATGDTIYTSSCGAGIFRSTNNGWNWQPANSGLPGQPYVLWAGEGIVIGGVASKLIPLYYGNQTNDNGGGVGCLGGTVEIGAYVSRDGGASWTSASDGLLQEGGFDICTDANKIFCATVLAGCFESSNGGVTWSRDFAGLTAGGSSTSATLSHLWSAQTPQGRTSLFADFPNYGALSSSGCLWKRDLPDTVWVPADSGIPTREQINGLLVDTAVNFGGAYLMFAATFGHGIYRSSDYGRHWLPADTSLGFVTSLVNYASRRKLFAGTHKGLYRSTDNGTTWYHYDLFNYAVPGSMPAYNYGNRMYFILDTATIVTADGFAFAPLKLPAGFTVRRFVGVGRLLFGLGTPGYVLSRDSGITWSQELLPYPQLGTHSLLQKDSLLYLGTDMMGMWVRRYSELDSTTDVAERSQPSTPTFVTLYPNPIDLNTSQRVVCVIPATEAVSPQSVHVTDVLGRTQDTEITLTKESGFRRLEIDISQLRPGVYAASQAGATWRGMFTVVR